MDFTIQKRAVSWNKYYSGVSGWKRQAISDEWHKEVAETLLEAGIRKNKLFENRVVISVRAFMKGNCIDPDNICCKLIIDPLVNYGLLKNDTYREIAEVRTAVEKLSPQEYDMIKVSIKEIKSG